mgnify:CR=1 FL=1
MKLAGYPAFVLGWIYLITAQIPGRQEIRKTPNPEFDTQPDTGHLDKILD